MSNRTAGARRFPARPGRRLTTVIAALLALRYRSPMQVKGIFLDKDGTLIENVPYNVDPALIRLTDRTLSGLQLLNRLGYRLIVISNQAGIALGRFDEGALGPVVHRIRELLLQADVELLDFYFCPHHPRAARAAYAVDCRCRKPRPGLIEQAARRHSIDLASSWMIGDILDDVEAGNRAGCRSILIDNGNETEWLTDSAWRRPDLIVPCIDDAAQAIAASR